MNEKYQPVKMRPVTDGLVTAQHAIETIVVKGEEENIFDYKSENPELFNLYMEINELVLKALEMYDNQ